MMAKDEEFKVIDRRGENKDKASKEEKGEGFVMKEAEEAPPTQPGEIDFSTLIFSFATGALISMGLAPDPASKKIHKNLPMAKQNIDILVMLREKTKGNLSKDENALLENLLSEIQLKYVQTVKS